MARRRGYRKRRSGFPVVELAALGGLLALISPQLLGFFVAIIGLVLLIAVVGKFALNGFDAASSTFSDHAPERWSLEVLRSLEWKRFEELAGAYFRTKGYDAKLTNVGADGGVDIIIGSKQGTEPLCLVQCKAWNSWQVGVKPIRELLGVMSSQGVKLGMFMTTSEFTHDAREFAAANNIRLFDGRQLLDEIGKLPAQSQKELLHLATKGEYTTPTCPKCDVKMVWRGDGPYKPFWGCANYPRCRHKFQVSEKVGFA